MNTPIANWLAGWYILDWRTLGLAKRNHLGSDSCVKYLSIPERGRFLHKLDYSFVLLFIYYERIRAPPVVDGLYQFYFIIALLFSPDETE